MIVVVTVIVVVRMPAIMIVVMALIVTVIMVMAVVMIVIVAAIMVMVMVVIMLLESGFQVLGKRLLGRAIDLSDGNSAFGSDLRARFKFRREQRTFSVTPAELAVQLTDRGLDDARLPSTL